MRIFKRHLNLEKDILISKKTVVFYDENYDIYSHHVVEKYEIAEGEFKGHTYFLFRLKDGKAVMNYNYRDYEKLYKYIDIKSYEPIFQRVEFEGIKYDINDLDVVPESYRYQ